MTFQLLSQVGRHPKLDKNFKVGVYGVVMHLAPADRSGFEVCPMRSAGCTAGCLNTAGFQYRRKEACRIKRTRWFFKDREAFMRQLAKEIFNARRRADKLGLKLGVRLNGTSDIPWESVPVLGFDNGFSTSQRNIMKTYPDAAFMDYTKRPNRKNLPANYRLVFSRAEDNDQRCREALDNGMNVAVVFRNQLPGTWVVGGRLLKVIDGDEHDWRYGEYDKHPERVVIGLRAKGKAKHDTTGFVEDAFRRDAA